MSSKAERKKFAAGLPTISAFTSHANYRAEMMSKTKLVNDENDDRMKERQKKQVLTSKALVKGPTSKIKFDPLL